MKEYFYIQADDLAVFRSAGLADFSSLMGADVGVLRTSEHGGRELRQLALGDGSHQASYFLKRLGRESWLLALRMLLFGRRPKSGPLRELTMLQALAAAGFDVMRPVAWGERSCGFLPLAGFLVVGAVNGEDVADLFERLPPGEKKQLMRAFGHLVGRLHAAGFYQPVRLKDIIAEYGHELPWSRLILIDRETSKPWAGGFFRHRCVTSLARAVRRTLRDGHRLGAGSACGFLRGYAEGVADKWSVSPQSLARISLKSIRKELTVRS